MKNTLLYRTLAYSFLMFLGLASIGSVEELVAMDKVVPSWGTPGRTELFFGALGLTACYAGYSQYCAYAQNVSVPPVVSETVKTIGSQPGLMARLFEQGRSLKKFLGLSPANDLNRVRDSRPEEFNTGDKNIDALLTEIRFMSSEQPADEWKRGFIKLIKSLSESQRSSQSIRDALKVIVSEKLGLEAGSALDSILQEALDALSMGDGSASRKQIEALLFNDISKK
jgi:hypothetical protein